MVSKYDIFYVIANKGEIRIKDILIELNKPEKDYQNIFNYVLELEKENLIKREKTVKIIHNKESSKLFNLISFCIRNNMNYNILLKKQFFDFIKKAALKEYFTNNDIKIHPQTFKIYTDILEKYGFLIIASKKPLKCKLLRHHFFFDLSEFLKFKLLFYEPKKSDLLPEIIKEVKKYNLNRKINYSIIEEMEKKNKVNFIYASLNLEGNPITLPETQKLILNDIMPKNQTLSHIREVTNYKKAVDLMNESSKRKEKLTLDKILNYHKIAMVAIKEAGSIRCQNVIIKNNPKFKTADYKEIEHKLLELLQKYEDFERVKNDIKEIIEFASYFHNEFQRIHPFIDGNSRISRLLMFHILKSKGIPISDLPIGYFDLYLDLTKRSTKRDDESFNYLVQEIILMNLKGINLKV